MPRWAARRDENEPEIIEALKAAGWGVFQVDARGFPDLVVAKGDRTHLIEVIGDAKWKNNRARGGLNPLQAEFHLAWPGTIHIVRTVEEALEVVRRVAKR